MWSESNVHDDHDAVPSRRRALQAMRHQVLRVSRRQVPLVVRRAQAPLVLTRRQALRGIGLAGFGAVLASCGNRASGSTPVVTSCVLTPRQIEGPYFIDTGLLRSDITEGKPGSS